MFCMNYIIWEFVVFLYEQNTFNQGDNGPRAIVAGTNHRNVNNFAFRNGFLNVGVLKYNRN